MLRSTPVRFHVKFRPRAPNFGDRPFSRSQCAGRCPTPWTFRTQHGLKDILGSYACKDNSSREEFHPSNAKDSSTKWRLFNVFVDADEDPGKDDFSVHEALVRAIEKKLGLRGDKKVRRRSQKGYSSDGITVVRKSFDSRKKRRKGWSYVVDVESRRLLRLGFRKFENKPGNFQLVEEESLTAPTDNEEQGRSIRCHRLDCQAEPVVVVGAGPAGLFAALEIAEAGLPVILVERGKPVETRGKDIGALVVRRKLESESNYCYGEGGAGTWSDGKLTTRIGRNDDPLRRVLDILHDLGAPDQILRYGKPHLGTDRLISILKRFRERLKELGVDIRFNSRVASIVVKERQVKGVVLADGSEILSRKVILAIGHSARELLPELLAQGVEMNSKPFAMGFRIEHPQALIDKIQYGVEDASTKVLRGIGPIPVADYRLASTIVSAKRAVDKSRAGPNSATRGAYSFCMCPGGIVVTTSTNAEELSINGMSFSRRNSRWANSAIVVTCNENDWAHYSADHGPLAGIELQRGIEREAALRGGGAFVAPAQRVVDFMSQRKSRQGDLPSTSYRLGVKAASLHDLYPDDMSRAFVQALEEFDQKMPGFASSPDALLLAAETRTSAAVRIERGPSTESPTVKGLHPCGEGAGYAGGIVSAAVDGMRVGMHVIADLTGQPVPNEHFQPLQETY